MGWKIAEARQHFSDVVRRASRKPQLILSRDRPVAAVIAADELEDFLAWRGSREKRSLADALAEATRICEEEAVALETPKRTDRSNAVVPRGKRAPR